MIADTTQEHTGNDCGPDAVRWWDKIKRKHGESGMNYDNIFIRMLSRVGDAMLLSILFVLSCVPIITIGAAFTSLYYTAMKGISGDDGYIWKFYTRSFKQNFKQATGM